MYIGCTSFANFLSKQGTLFSKSPIPEYYINQFYHSLNPALLNSLSLLYDHALIYIIKYHAIIYIMKYPLLNKNKRPMGHIAHLRNQFKSMNTSKRSYDYIHYKIGPVVQEEKMFELKYLVEIDPVIL